MGKPASPDPPNIDWQSIVDAMERGEDVDERLDEVAGTKPTPRSPLAEQVYEERRRRRKPLGN